MRRDIDELLVKLNRIKNALDLAYKPLFRSDYSLLQIVVSTASDVINIRNRIIGIHKAVKYILTITTECQFFALSVRLCI
ncbi:hypothetical protein Y030_5643 [Burkholderia pseudomallei MSHR332]|nr:hypothetical protein Y030_5643 [Burkholderia pseudomallei MSHR332]